MGSKGSQTSTTNQSQTYTPTGGNYITNALNQAQNAAQLPFNIPQAPVAGFSADQQQAFQNVNNAQGMAQPYFNQANQYFNQSAQGPNVSQFFNPYASAVTSQLNNIFGQQASQNTGQLTQAAGGVGADRIAVGQANLANQQGLAAGQTLAGLYAPSLQAAQNQQNILQSAGYGTAALGSQAQNAALQGAQAQLGTGGLQQQLQQAQLNAPYQQQLAQAAFPYQQSQFLTGAVGALAPGLGGTTAGTGTTTSQYNPSLWGQIGGGLTALGGVGGYLGGSGKGSSPSYGGGNMFSGDAYGGSSNNPLPGLSASDYGPGYAEGGPAHGEDYQRAKNYIRSLHALGLGGSWSGKTAEDDARERTQEMADDIRSPRPPISYDGGGGVSDEPIDVAPRAIIPEVRTPQIQAHMPSLNLNPPQQQQGSGGGGGAGAGIGTAIQLASMFLARGGAAKPHDGTKSFNPYFLEGGNTDVINPDEPFRMTPAADVQDWRDTVDRDIAAGRANSPTMAYANEGANQPSPLDTANWPYGPVGGPSDPRGAVNQFAGNAAPQGLGQGQASAYAPPQAEAPAAAAAPADEGPSLGGFLKSPWAALTAGGLEAMRTGSLASGFGTTMKLAETQREAGQKDETIKQAAERLKQEAKFHEDEYNKMKPYQQLEARHAEEQLKLQQAEFEFKKTAPTQIGRNIYGQPVFAVHDPSNPGAFLDPATHKPIDLSQIGDADEANIESMAKAVANYDQPPVSPNKATTPVGMAIMNRARQINGDYSAKNYDEAKAAKVKFGSGPQGDAVRSFGTAYRHIELGEQLIDAMGSGDTALVNRLRNAWRTEFGGNPAPNNFAAAKDIISDEILKAVIGARGALGDRETAQKRLNEANSPKLLHSLMKDVYKPLMIGQLKGYKQQYEGATHGAKDFDEKLTPEVRDALHASETKAPPAAPATAAPAASGQPPVPGAKQAPDGHWYVQQNGKYFRVDQ